MIFVVVISHLLCIALGCVLWRYGVEPSKWYLRWHRASSVASKTQRDRWRLEAEYLGEVVTRMTEVAKEQASLAKARSTVAETGTQNIDMMDEQEEKRVKRFRRG